MFAGINGVEIWILKLLANFIYNLDVCQPLTVGGWERFFSILFFLSHFLCVKDKEPKRLDFLSMGMTHN